LRSRPDQAERDFSGSPRKVRRNVVQPASFRMSSGALTGNSARRAGDNFQRRSGRRSALRREPVPGNVHSSFARLGEPAHAGGEPQQVRPFGTGIFVVSCCSSFPHLDAVVRPCGCVEIESSCQSMSSRRLSRATLVGEYTGVSVTAVGDYAAMAQQFGFDGCTEIRNLDSRPK